MKTQLTGICRGDGLVYFKFELKCHEIPESLRVLATADDGCPLPSSWYPLTCVSTSGSCSIAVVAPLLAEGDVVVRIAPGQYGEEGESRFKVSAARAKWGSRLTYKLKADTALEIRDIDQQDGLSGISVHFEYIVPDGDDFLLRGRLTFPACDRADIAIEVLDESGHPSGLQPMIVSDYTRPSRIDPSTTLRERTFTMPLPNGFRGLTMIARDEAGRMATGFRSIGPGYFSWLFEKGAGLWRSAGVDPAYHDWFLRNRADEAALAFQRDARFSASPSFSIVVPLYNTPVELFWAMVESVVRQSYGKWELILVNASPDNVELAHAVRSAASQDSRIRFTTLKENLGITENTNYGIAAATGDFVCFLDHDDVLEPDCLFEYARAINERPDTDLLYCDEDKVSEDGSHFYNPFFKTEFDIDLLRSHNYVCHFLCVRKAVLDEIAPPTSAYDGAQDHNLTLIVSEHARHIHHVSKILYHWRATEASTASDDAGERHVKDYANDAGRRAIAEHLQRLGVPADVEPGPAPYSHHVKYLVQGSPLVSIIIPNKDCSDMLERCIESILSKTKYGNLEIVIVENNSTEAATWECYERLKARDERISVIAWPGEFNFSKIVNFGVAASRGEYLLLLNNDTEVLAPEWLENMLGACQRPEVGIVGAKLLYPNRTIQHAGVIIGRRRAAHHAFVGLPDWGYFGRAVLTHQCSAVTGACLLVKRSVFDEVGVLDEEFAVAYNDIDFCLKVRDAGFAIVYEPTAQLVHYESVSRGLDFATPEKRVRSKREETLLMQRWAKVFAEGDPFFNPNLKDHFFTLRDERTGASSTF